MDLEDACTVWQSGRDGGSALLRGAARELTGFPHYFDAPYIREYERKAAGDPTTSQSCSTFAAPSATGCCSWSDTRPYGEIEEAARREHPEARRELELIRRRGREA